MTPRWLAGVLLSSALLVAACGGDDEEIDTTDVDVEALLLASAERMEEETAFHFELELENGRVQIVRGINVERAEGDVAAADRVQFKVEARVGPLLAELELIVLPDEGWITNPLTGRWERERIDIDQFFDPADGITAVMRSITDAEVTGSETIDGVATYRVEATIDSELLTLFGNPQSGVELELRAWIGVDDPLVHRIEVVGGVLAREEDDLIRRLNLSQFGADFDIKAPR
jgi:LppX/LprAFG-like lipoprotein